MIALFRMKYSSNAMALCWIATILLAQGGVHKDKLADHLQVRPKKSGSSCRIAYNLYRLPCPHTSRKTVQADEVMYM